LRRGDQPVFQFADLGSFAEQLLVHENMLVKIRPDMPLDKAALIGCGVTTGVGAALNTAKVPRRRDRRRDRLRRHRAERDTGRRARWRGSNHRGRPPRVEAPTGARLRRDDVVDVSAGDPVGTVLELTDGGVDHSFEAIGLAETAQRAFNMLRKGGTATVIGMIPLGERVEIDGFQLLLEKRLQGSNLGSNRFRIDMPQYVEWYLAGTETRRVGQRRHAARADQRRLRDPEGRRGRPPARHVRLSPTPAEPDQPDVLTCRSETDGVAYSDLRRATRPRW
jgi:S-(hydroxymethyl)glutathione dehydrogenase/alcohol dehydrogenase